MAQNIMVLLLTLSIFKPSHFEISEAYLTSTIPHSTSYFLLPTTHSWFTNTICCSVCVPPGPQSCSVCISLSSQNHWQSVWISASITVGGGWLRTFKLFPLRLLGFLTHTSSILKIFPYKMYWNVWDFLKTEMPP